MKRVRLPALALLLAVALIVGTFPMALAEPAERVLIEYMPGKGAAVRNAVLAAGGQVHHDLDRINTVAVSVTGRWANRLAKDPNVVMVEADPLRYLAGKPAPEGETDTQVVPWGIDAVQAPAVWAEGFEGEGVTVCIIDTGLYQAHEDIDETYVLGGLSQDPLSEWYEDGNGHGTHVAGTVSAADNGVGVIGVSPGKVSLFMVKIFGQDGLWISKAHASDLIAAAYTCADNGANIISMSLSGTNKSGKERMAFEDLYAQGVLSVAAASNDGIEEYHYPASYDSVISVAALDESLNFADFSQFNDQVELAAPGVGVLSTVPWLPNSFLFAGEEEYQGQPMEFAPYGEVTGTLVDGGLCLASDPPVDWSGAVVLCSRGEVSFAEKVTTVINNGGIGAAIYNNAEGLFSGTLGEEGDWIAAISLSDADGLAALAYVGQDATLRNQEPILGNGYEAWGGTSMATPHVSGVAALLWSANPDLTNVEIREAMAMTALDLGDPGRDVHYGYGLVQAYDALNYLIDLKPGKGPKGPKN